MTPAFPFAVPPGITEVEDWLTGHGFELVEFHGKSVMASHATFRNGDGLIVRLFADRGYWESHIVFPSGFWTHAVTADLLSRGERVAKPWDAYSLRASKATGYAADLRRAITWMYLTPDCEAQLREEQARQAALAGPEHVAAHPFDAPVSPASAAPPVPSPPAATPEAPAVAPIDHEARSGGLLSRFRRLAR